MILYIVGTLAIFALGMAVITTLRERAQRNDTYDLFYQDWRYARDSAHRSDRKVSIENFHYPVLKVWKGMIKRDMNLDWVAPIIQGVRKDNVTAVKNGILVHIQPCNLTALFIYADVNEMRDPVLKYVQNETWRLSFDYKYGDKAHTILGNGRFLSGSVDDFENDLAIIKLLGA